MTGPCRIGGYDPWVPPLGPWWNSSLGFADEDNAAIEGDYIAIGERRGYENDNTDLDTEVGRVYVWERLGASDWTNYACLNASDRSAGAEFGRGVAISQGKIIVLASGVKKVYFFERIGGTWTQTDVFELTDENGDPLDVTPYNLAYHGDSFIVGAYNENGSKGAAYVYANPQAIGTVVMIL